MLKRHKKLGRKFLVSCNGTTEEGYQLFLSFDLPLNPGEKLTHEILKAHVDRIKEERNYKVLLPIAFSEYDQEVTND